MSKHPIVTRRRWLQSAAAFALTAGLAGTVRAQERGQTRQNLQRLPDVPESPFAPAEEILDYRELMRQYVQSISSYARRQKSDFQILARGGLELLSKVDPIDTTKRAPARAYMHSLDGLLVDGLHYGLEAAGQPTPAEKRQQMLDNLGPALDARLKVLTLDYATSAEAIDECLQKSAAQGLVPFVAQAKGLDMTGLPDYPPRPFRENSNSIMRLESVQNFACIRNPDAFGREDVYALRMHDTNFDLFVTNPFLDMKPLTKQAVETLKYKKLGARRLVMAVIDVTSASTYKFYWKDGWAEGNPAWIKSPTPGDPDTYYVQFWQPGWQSVIFGNPESYIYGLIRQGYDGVILEGLDSFRFFEGTLDREDGFLF